MSLGLKPDFFSVASSFFSAAVGWATTFLVGMTLIGFGVPSIRSIVGSANLYLGGALIHFGIGPRDGGQLSNVGKAGFFVGFCFLVTMPDLLARQSSYVNLYGLTSGRGGAIWDGMKLYEHELEALRFLGLTDAERVAHAKSVGTPKDEAMLALQLHELVEYAALPKSGKPPIGAVFGVNSDTGEPAVCRLTPKGERVLRDIKGAVY